MQNWSNLGVEIYKYFNLNFAEEVILRDLLDSKEILNRKLLNQLACFNSAFEQKMFFLWKPVISIKCNAAKNYVELEILSHVYFSDKHFFIWFQLVKIPLRVYRIKAGKVILYSVVSWNK